MTANQTSPNAQFTAFLSRFPPEIVALAKGCMPKLRRALPGVAQLGYDYNHALVVSFARTGRGYVAPVAIFIDESCVRLYFPKDTPDPKDRLEGSGGKVRSVVVKAASDLDKGDVHELIKAAIKQAGVKLSGTGA